MAFWQILLAAGLTYLVGAFVALGIRTWRAYRRPRPAPKVAFVLPSAEETRRAIREFQEAARRYELVEFVWNKMGPAAFAARCGGMRRR